MKLKLIFLITFIAVMSVTQGKTELLPPERFIGHRVGEDYKLAKYEKITEYFDYIGQNSNRVNISRVGVTTEGRTMILAEISSPSTISNLDRYKAMQRKLADPRLITGEPERRRLKDEAKVVVYVNCNLHSTEIGSSQMAMELLHDLATGDCPQILDILEKTIVVLVPSANPDGLDKVIDWYERSLGKPWEGGGMPWLYQKYAGHDNNRDWFMLNLQETRILTNVLYNEWFPHIVYDIHQMGNRGARFFLPPFAEPKNPNVDALADYMLLILGGHMSAELNRAGKTGILHSSGFDNWWQGGFRTTVYRHNMMGILTESASVRIASPVFQQRSDLTGAVREQPEYTSTRYPDPWPGGWWRLRDIVEYQKVACMSIFTLAARYQDLFHRNYLKLGEEALRKGETEPPFAWLIPPDQRDRRSVYEMLKALHAGGVEIHRATAAFTADNILYPTGTYIIYCAQPYRAHINDLMEIQKYPERFRYPGGPPIPPYDTAGWTLPLQMGVRRAQARLPFQSRAEKLETVPFPEAVVQGRGINGYIVNASSNDDFRLMNRLHNAGIGFSQVKSSEEWEKVSGEKVPEGSIYIPMGASVRRELTSILEGISSELNSVNLRGKPGTALSSGRMPRIALYQPFTASIEEGWTRLILDNHEFTYSSIHNDDIRAGKLKNRYDSIILPNIRTAMIMDGAAPESTEPQYVGGIGLEGVIALQEFVMDGGTLVCMDNSANFAIEKFNLPVRNIVQGKRTEEFFCPGSIVRIWNDSSNPVGWGMPDWASAAFRSSQAFQITSQDKPLMPTVQCSAHTVTHYSDTVLLESGWMNGEDLVKGASAVVDVTYGDGKIILIGFNVQNRGQAHGTFRLFFNAIMQSVLD